MQETNSIMRKLQDIEQLITEQGLLNKEVLNFPEACTYLDISASHLYKLTSTKSIPHFCPQGKRLYFNRIELDKWLQRNRQSTQDELEQIASNYVLKNKRSR